MEAFKYSKTSKKHSNLEKIDPANIVPEEKHNPAKLSNVDELLQKFKGKEVTLYKSDWESNGAFEDDLFGSFFLTDVFCGF